MASDPLGGPSKLRTADQPTSYIIALSLLFLSVLSFPVNHHEHRPVSFPHIETN